MAQLTTKDISLYRIEDCNKGQFKPMSYKNTTDFVDKMQRLIAKTIDPNEQGFWIDGTYIWKTRKGNKEQERQIFITSDFMVFLLDKFDEDETLYRIGFNFNV